MSETPRFTWQLSDPDHARGQKQTGYQVLVASSPALLDERRADIVGQRPGSLLAVCAGSFRGQRLTSGENCFWKVRVWTRTKKTSAWSPTARFSMGLLEPSDWTGPWIKHPTAPAVDHIWFRKTFTLRDKAASAFIYVAPSVITNFTSMGRRLMRGSWLLRSRGSTRRVLYVTYDITERASSPVTTASPSGPVRAGPATPYFKTKPALRVQLERKTTGGDAISLASDTSWRCEISSSEDIGGCEYRDHGGEQIDARKYIPEWNAVEFDDKEWQFAAAVSINATLSAQMVEPSRMIETIDAQSMSGDGPYKVDFGTNFSGWISIKHEEPVGRRCRDHPGLGQSRHGAGVRAKEHLCLPGRFVGNVPEPVQLRRRAVYYDQRPEEQEPGLADIEGLCDRHRSEPGGPFLLLQRFVQPDLRNRSVDLPGEHRRGLHGGLSAS